MGLSFNDDETLMSEATRTLHFGPQADNSTSETGGTSRETRTGTLLSTDIQIAEEN